MSVWDDPCYSIEPLRNAVNNYPRTSLKAFPKELAGIANFTFGKCETRHGERSERNAFDLFSSDQKSWHGFVAAGRARGNSDNSILFENTVRQTNIKYAGIRSVYWAYKHFANGDWKTSTTLDYADLKTVAKSIFRISAPASRNPQATYDEYAEVFLPEALDSRTESWFSQEALADSIDKIWTINRKASYKRKKSVKEAIIEKAFRSKVVKAKVGIEEDKLANRERLAVRNNLNMAYKFDIEGHNKAYKEVMKRVKDNEQISELDAKLTAIYPYEALPTRDGRLLVFRFEGGYILYDKNTKEGGIFFHKDHSRLVNMIKSRAKLIMYYTNYDASDLPLSNIMKRKFFELEKTFFDSYRLNSDIWANTVCRAYDVAQFIFLADLASDMSTRSLEDQWAKVAKEKLDEIVNIRAVIRIVDDESLGVKESLELLKFYKIFPCPDFCIYSVIDTMEEKSKTKNVSSWDTVLGKNSKGDVITSRDEFKAYSMRNKAITFYDMYGRFPGTLKAEAISNGTVPTHMLSYPMISTKVLGISDMQYVDMRGTFAYVRYDAMEDVLVKDKTTAVPAHVDKDDPPFFARNQVLQYLFDPKFKSQEAVNNIFRGEKEEIKKHLEIEIALKAEAKKPSSRPFGMATDVARRQLSEFERNVAEFVTHQRGSSQGKSDLELDSKLASLARTPDLVNTEIMMSFDLAAFSPRMSTDFKRIGYEVWSEVFGEDDIMPIMEIFNSARVRFKKFDVDDSFNFDGDDMEGFNGRMNTSLHADLMGYAVYKLKELGLVKENADLEVLIDDGLLRLIVAEQRGGEKWKTAVKIIEMVYNAAGLEISWDKTFVSEVMCQYLNRVYYDGIEVTPGAKAFLRIGKLSTAAVPTLADEIASISATARGAIKSGSDHLLAYMGYCIEIYHTIRRWSGHRNDLGSTSNLAFMCFVPVGLGGLGISTLFGLSTNENYVSIHSGVAAMKMICHRFSSFVTLSDKILNAGMRPMEDESILRSPFSMRTVYRTLNTRRFANAAKAIVTNKAVNPFFKAIVQVSRSDNVDFALATISSLSVINEIQRQKLYAMSPLSFVEKVIGKLQTSGTAARLVGNVRCAALLMINKSEAKQLVKEMVLGIFSKRFVGYS